MADFFENNIDQMLEDEFVSTSKSNLDLLIDGLPQISLNPEQQSRLSSINIDNKRFAERALIVMHGSGRNILPGFFDERVLANDLGVYNQAETLKRETVKVAVFLVRNALGFISPNAY